jgi:hypothetical protein
MANVELKAVNAIYRKEKGKQVRHEPGTIFTCTEEEAAAENYVKRGAAMPVKSEKSAAPKAATKKPAAKKAEPKKAEPKKADADKDDADKGDNGDDGDNELLS